MTHKKISELDAITGSNTAATDVFVVVDTSTGQTKKITREELNNAIEQDVLSSIDIDTINGDFSVNGNINLGDNNKAIFGAGSDLEIYHDGSNSIVKDAGTGSLELQGSSWVILKGATSGNWGLASLDGAQTNLYHNGSLKLGTTATGVDVTGTVTADKVVVSDGLASYISTFENTQASNAGHGLYVETLYNTSSNQVLRLESNGGSNIVANFAGNGDISFYEDTGTTAKFFWDASAERLGLGTASPDATLQVVASSTNSEYARFSSTDSRHLRFSSFDTASTDAGHDINASSSNGVVTISTGGTERMRIDADGLTVDGLIKFSGLAPTVDYDFNASGSVTSADALAYGKMGSGIATAVNISSVDTITPSWSALSGSTYSDNKFRIMSARGNATDALRIVSSLTAEGHGDTTIIGNINVDGVNTRIITGLGITGGDVELLSNDSRRVNIAANGDVSFYEDTGTTAKLFWDASAEALGIGTTSPAAKIDSQEAYDTVSNILTNGTYAAKFGGNTAVGAAGRAQGIMISGRSGNARGAAIIAENQGSGNGHDLLFATSADASVPAERLRITSTGLVGIGTDSPSTKLMLEHNNDGAVGGTIRIKDRDSQQGANQLTGAIEFESEDATEPTSGVSTAIKAFAASSTGGSYLTISTTDISTSTLDERLRITDAGLVGIGTSLPSRELEVTGSGNVYIKVTAPTANDSAGIELANTGATWLIQNDDTSSAALTFDRAGSERMRIDSSGNLLVGKTSTSSAFTTAGVDLRPEGRSFMTRSAGPSLYLSRTTSDGNIAAFYKDGTAVGSIGSAISNAYFAGSSTGITFGIANVYPTNAIGTKSNGTLTLGSASNRFKDLYLGGTAYIGTSIAANTSDGSDTSRLSIGGGGDANSTGRGSLVQYHGNEHASVAGAMRHFMGNVSGSYISWHLGSGSEAMRVDSSGNLLVGKTAMNYTSEGFAFRERGEAYITSDGRAPLLVNRLTSDGDIVSFRKDGTVVGSIGVASGDLNINGGANHSGIRFQATGLYPLENGTASSGEIDLGAEGSKFKNLYLNGGVYLGGTTAANHLDDYEEGTFTPTANTNITSITNGDGHYVKVGNLVTVMFYATIDPASTTLNLFIGGLPFAVADNFSLTNVGATGLLFEDNSIFTIWAQETSSNVVVEFDRPLQGSTSSTSKNYRGTLTYFTA